MVYWLMDVHSLDTRTEMLLSALFLTMVPLEPLKIHGSFGLALSPQSLML